MIQIKDGLLGGHLNSNKYRNIENEKSEEQNLPGKGWNKEKT